MLVEAIFQVEAMKQGWIVSQPFGDNAPYDFIVDTGDRLLKVQCKHLAHARGSKDAYSFNTHKKTGHRRNTRSSYVGLVDYFFAYSLEDDVHIWMPIGVCNTSEQSVRKEPTPTSPKAKLIKDYLIC